MRKSSVIWVYHHPCMKASFDVGNTGQFTCLKLQKRNSKCALWGHQSQLAESYSPRTLLRTSVVWASDDIHTAQDSKSCNFLKKNVDNSVFVQLWTLNTISLQSKANWQLHCPESNLVAIQIDNSNPRVPYDLGFFAHNHHRQVINLVHHISPVHGKTYYMVTPPYQDMLGVYLNKIIYTMYTACLYHISKQILLLLGRVR